MRDQPEILEDDADTAAKSGQARARHRHRILAEQADDAAAGALRKVEKLQQRRLAGAACPGQEIEGAAGQREADVGQRFLPGAVPQPNIFELHDICHAPGRNRSI